MFVKINSNRYININHITLIEVETRPYVREMVGKWRVWVNAPGRHHETFGFDDEGIEKLIAEINSVIQGGRPVPPILDRPPLKRDY